MSSRGFLLSLTCLLLPLTVALAKSPSEWVMVQPAESRDGLLLWSRPGGVRVELAGGMRGYGLDPREELTEVVETKGGWAAAGLRADDGESRLVLLESDGRSVRRLETPSPGGAALQLRPRLLVRHGRLAAVAWLEGGSARELAVRARNWSGASWGAAFVVSPSGPGSQTGLSAATLANGGDLLVWSAFDGVDDEIVYSRSSGDGWTPPRRVAAGNRVPDVAPAVAAVAGGALAAWSRFDGDVYELVMARYRRGGWKSPRVIAPNGLFARFVRLDDRLFLLYRTARPRGWEVAEIGPNGAVRRRAAVLRTNPRRPAIRLEGPLGVSLVSPDRSIARGYWDQP